MPERKHSWRGISWEVALGFDPPSTWLAKACSDRDSKFPVSFYAGTHTSPTLETASPTSTSGGVHITRVGIRGSALLDAMGEWSDGLWSDVGDLCLLPPPARTSLNRMSFQFAENFVTRY